MHKIAMVADMEAAYGFSKACEFLTKNGFIVILWGTQMDSNGGQCYIPNKLSVVRCDNRILTVIALASAH